MRVCVITPAFYPAIVYGGPIVSIYHACVELSKLGVEVFVATTNANGMKKLDVEPNRYIAFNDHLFVKYYDDTVIGRFSWRYIFSVWQDIRGCDLIRVEDIFSTYIPPSLVFARVFRKPILISARGALSKWSLQNKRALSKKIWLALLINPFLRNAWWHATSEQEKREILELYPAAMVIVIPNGADVAGFGNARRIPGSEYLKKFAGVDRQAGKIIVSMGRLHKKKGFSLLIEAFASLLANYQDAILLIAGDDDGERLNLEILIEQLGLKGKVFLIGALDGQIKAEFLSGADLFVLPSYSENFGNVYLEAMAAGLPIVASKETPWEQIERIGCGKWVECSADAVRSAMHDILADDPRGMGRLAKDYAQQYDWSNIAKEFKSVFGMMLGCDAKKRTSESGAKEVMKIAKELQEILICPSCKSNELTVNENGLVCSQCKLNYPSIADIPVMLINKNENNVEYSIADEKAYYSQNWPSRALPYKHLQSYIDCWLPEAVSLFGGKMVLDIGAGEATYTRMLAEVYSPRRVVACELFTERMLPAMRANKVDNLSFVTGSCFSLPFADGAFDVVFGSLVLHQLPDLDLAIAEIDRVLKQGGAYIGIEANPYNPVILYRFLRGKHSKNQYLLNESHLSKFTPNGFIVDTRFFYARFPSLRNRFMTTCMGIIAKKESK